MAKINPITLIITLNLNELNNSIKRQRLSDFIKKTKSCPKETHFRFKDIFRLKVKAWKKIYQENSHHNLTLRQKLLIELKRHIVMIRG